MTFKYIYCKDCGEKMHSDSKSCVCGWQANDDTKKTNCTWKNNGRECPVYATITHEGRWLCTHHYPLMSNPEAANAMLERILRGDIPKTKDWRKEMLEEYMKKREKNEKE
tara:strand:- start:1449 stop:1778 length:330 start_codon:yes stop_codon:yes gene_type:complete